MLLADLRSPRENHALADEDTPTALPPELVGGGNMSDLIEAQEGSSAAFGPPSAWPQPLRTAAGIMLHTKQPALIAWGREQLLLSNDAFCALSDLPATHWLGRCLPDVWPALAALLATAAEEALWLTEQQLTVPQAGAERLAWFSIAASPISDQQGRAGGVYCTLSDVSQQLLHIHEIETELAYRRRLFAQTPSFIAALSGPDHVYKLVNQAYLQLVGHQDIIGKSIREVLPELREQGYLEVLDRVYRSGKPSIGREQRYMLQRRSTDAVLEERFLDIVYQPIKDDAGQVKGVLIEGFDVTERIDAEKALRHHAEVLQDQVEVRTQDLRQAEAALHQAQKMEALGQLTGGIAHDFNNLLLGINGALALAERRLQQDRQDDVGRFIALAMQSANRAAGLVHRLLAFARRQPLDTKAVEVGPLIASIEDLLRRTIGESIELALIQDQGEWLALCDPNQLESAILNLAINARDAMPQGGKLTIASYNLRIKQSEPTNPPEATPGDYVCVRVSDTGSGMAPEVLSHVFEPFFTTKAVGQGTGLGLPMIYGFARQSGGYVQIDSVVGVGTTVRLCLPRSRQAVDAEPMPAGLREVHKAAPGAVALVVEDDAAVRQLVVELLRELGYLTLEAADGLAGLKLLQSRVRVDLLVTDIGLPGMSGRQMVKAARVYRPELRVLYMTAYDHTGSVDHGDPETDEELITKPFSLEAFAQRLEQIMGASGNKG